MATQSPLVERIDAIRDDLAKAPSAIFCLQQRVAQLQAELDAVKAEDVAEAKTALDEVTAGAALEALSAGRIDGKNQAQRDVQLKVILADDADVGAARERLYEAERLRREIAHELDVAQSELSLAGNTFRAARYLADLEAAQLRSLALEEAS